MTKFSSFFKILGALFVMISFSSFVAAAKFGTCYGKPIKWKNNRTTMYIHYPQGSELDLHSQWAMASWADIAGTAFTYYVNWRSGNASLGNGFSEISSAPIVAGHVAHVQTKTLCTKNLRLGTVDKHYITEADLTLNSTYGFTLDTFEPAHLHEPFSFDKVVLHELGHTLGLDEPPQISPFTYFAVMLESYPFGHYDNLSPHADDIVGLRALYPDPSYQKIDLAVSKYREDLSHSHNGLYTKVIVPSTGGYRTWFNKGDPMEVEYTFENLGTTTVTADVRFYFSVDNYVSAADTYIGSASWIMPAASGVIASAVMDVPLSLPYSSTGNYYIGYVVSARNGDDDNYYNNFVSQALPLRIY
ncbi:hypothetical protein P886_3742 [Alteromonadaceae bacterium 2753L.S.0a.02]|nr:hypothetical protein P886_3742 [Alteromonadaceae bacterium 2753L.S.0a.02]